MKFNSIIWIKTAKVESHKWKDLGFDFEGETEALVFNVEIDKDRISCLTNTLKATLKSIVLVCA
jgi:hypothetical protein